jgi:hypothetical protein
VTRPCGGPPLVIIISYFMVATRRNVWDEYPEYVPNPMICLEWERDAAGYELLPEDPAPLPRPEEFSSLRG